VMDLMFRLFLQKIPVLNIRPLLALPITRSTIVSFALGKTMVSFFNLAHAFFFVPFTIVLLKEGYNPLGVIAWHLAMLALICTNNFLNILINNKDYLFYIFITIIGACGYMHYAGLFNITDYTVGFFQNLFEKPYWALLPIGIVVYLGWSTFQYFKKNLYLDTGLSIKHAVAKTEQFDWLDKYGTLGTFLKNDIRLIKRNKRSKTTVTMSLLFLFYGLLFFGGAIESYDNPMMHMFAGIFVTGGFLFTFGQFVPSWDSAYYQLMMTQNISYRQYLTSKWWLVVIATIVSVILSSFYLYFGLDIYLIIVAAGIYNIGINSHLVLLGGAYVKTPIDLNSSKGAFGDKKAFNIKTMLITIPKLLMPMIIYALGFYLINATAGVLFVAITGIIGFALKNFVFSMIEKIYKTEKYETIHSYKQRPA
jgi:multisubunit Na+/H+ antiporter MnhC subunit